jgi:RNA-directed DNA polymerase
MKTHRHLYASICTFENLHEAFRNARRGKRSRPDVATFEFNLEPELTQLQQELVDRTYRPGSYRHFTLYERKPRRISAAPFRDRVVHHALCNVIEPIWEARFITIPMPAARGKGPMRPWIAARSFPAVTPMSCRQTSSSFFRQWTMPSCATCWPAGSPARRPCG